MKIRKKRKGSFVNIETEQNCTQLSIQRAAAARAREREREKLLSFFSPDEYVDSVMLLMMTSHTTGTDRAYHFIGFSCGKLFSFLFLLNEPEIFVHH